jgi:hypothetical protein
MPKRFAFLLLLALFAVSVRAEDEGTVESALQECLDGLAQDAFDEAELHVQRDDLHEELRRLENEKNVYQWSRDHNRTEAMRCLKSLAVCNDNNQWKEVDSNGQKRQPTKRGTCSPLFPHVKPMSKVLMDMVEADFNISRKM